MCTIRYEAAPRPIDDLPTNLFVEGWTAVVGEPPSIMLDRHHDMITVLVETVPAEPGEPVMVRSPMPATAVVHAR